MLTQERLVAERADDKMVKILMAQPLAILTGLRHRLARRGIKERHRLLCQGRGFPESGCASVRASQLMLRLVSNTPRRVAVASDAHRGLAARVKRTRNRACGIRWMERVTKRETQRR